MLIFNSNVATDLKKNAAKILDFDSVWKVKNYYSYAEYFLYPAYLINFAKVIFMLTKTLAK